MRKSILCLLITVFCLSFYSSKAQQNEIGLVFSPLNKEDIGAGLWYKQVWNHELSLRLLASFSMDTDKEIRSDSATLRGGEVAYSLGVGIQKNLPLGKRKNLSAYIACDGYWNSAFIREPWETYYGYHFNFGLMPLAGLQFTPYDRLRISLESRANFNVNLQEYSAEGENYDRRFSFNGFDHLAFGIGYLL
ncbi:MAG: hypothetical protein JXR19_04400 [Bacteroidia bacterium]